MSTQTEVQQAQKPLLGWKSKIWLFVICFFVGNIILPLIWQSDGSTRGGIIHEGVRVAFLLFSLWLASYLIKRGTHPFWTLVHNDMQSVFKWKNGMVVLVIGLFTALLIGKYQAFLPGYVNYYSSLPVLLLPFMLAYYSTKKEWTDKTASWWLTLPYSKEQLISSKIIALTVRLFSIYLLATLLSDAVLSFIPHLESTGPALRESTSKTLLLYLTFIDTSWIFNSGIILLLAGIVSALLSESMLKKYRWLFVLSFLLLSVGYFSLLNYVGAYLFKHSHIIQFVYIWINVRYMLSALFTFLSCWLLAYLLYRCAVYVCEKKIEV